MVIIKCSEFQMKLTLILWRDFTHFSCSRTVHRRTVISYTVLSWDSLYQLVMLTMPQLLSKPPWSEIMLPLPAFTFTLPSIHDGTLLDCRLYLPSDFMPSKQNSERTWRKRAAILAHPYVSIHWAIWQDISWSFLLEGTPGRILWWSNCWSCGGFNSGEGIRDWNLQLPVRTFLMLLWIMKLTYGQWSRAFKGAHVMDC